MRDEKSIDAAVRAGIERFGKIDALVNNAGYGQYGLLEATTQDQIKEQFAVNIFGVMATTRAILPHFRNNRGGTIINVSSGAGVFTLPLISVYSASKFALEGFSEAVSYELPSQNITVKIIEPHGGVTSTAFNERTVSEFACGEALASYKAFVDHTQSAFATMVSARALSADDVAAEIYRATTDGSHRLRYLIGDDARGSIKARHELQDQDYVDFMRVKFGLET